MVFGVAFLLLVSLIISIILDAVGSYFGNLFPGIGLLWLIINFFFSLSVITVLFALIFKILPDFLLTGKMSGQALLLLLCYLFLGNFPGNLFKRECYSVLLMACRLVYSYFDMVYYSAQILF